MIVAAHQPNYLPNLGFFYKMAQADSFVVFANAQFEKQEGWQQRHKIKGPNNDLWLTVPVLGSNTQLIKNVKIDNRQNWRHKHKKSLELSYNRAAGKDFLPLILQIYDKEWERLAELNFEIIKTLREIIGIETPLVFDEEVGGKKQDLLVNICNKYGADTYLSGLGAKNYMTQKYFDAMKTNGIKHKFIDKNITGEYPYSTVHYLMTEGKDWVSKLVRT